MRAAGACAVAENERGLRCQAFACAVAIALPREVGGTCAARSASAPSASSAGPQSATTLEVFHAARGSGACTDRNEDALQVDIEREEKVLKQLSHAGAHGPAPHGTHATCLRTTPRCRAMGRRPPTGVRGMAYKRVGVGGNVRDVSSAGISAACVGTNTCLPARHKRGAHTQAQHATRPCDVPDADHHTSGMTAVCGSTTAAAFSSDP